MRIGLLLERGDFILDCRKPLLAVLRGAQLRRGVACSIAFGAGDCSVGLHLVDEILSRGGIGHHIHHFRGGGAVEAFTRHLGDRFLRIVIVRAGLLDLFLQVGLVLLRGLESVLCGLRLGLRLFRAVLRVFQRLLRGGDLVLVQIVELENLIRQLRADTGQFGFELTLALELCLVLLHRDRLRWLRRRDYVRSACGDKSERCDQCAHDGVDLFRALHITAFLVVYRTLYITMLDGQ